MTNDLRTVTPTLGSAILDRANALLDRVDPGDTLTVRDHFAGCALTGLLSKGALTYRDSIVSEAYALADAMLAARKEPR